MCTCKCVCEIGRACSTYAGEGRRGVYRVLMGRPEGKRPLERPRRRWENNIKIDLQEVGYEGMNTARWDTVGWDTMLWHCRLGHCRFWHWNLWHCRLWHCKLGHCRLGRYNFGHYKLEHCNWDCVVWDIWPKMLLSSSEDMSDVDEGFLSLWRSFFVNVVVVVVVFALVTFKLSGIFCLCVCVRRHFFKFWGAA
jgi:hypothetical protein